jgi:hypothetical protein
MRRTLFRKVRLETLALQTVLYGSGALTLTSAQTKEYKRQKLSYYDLWQDVHYQTVREMKTSAKNWKQKMSSTKSAHIEIVRLTAWEERLQ